MTNKTTAKRGRPAFSDKKVASYESKLYRLLQGRLKKFVQRERLNVRALAAAISVRPATVYRWLQADRLTHNGATLIIKVSDGTLTSKDLADFLTAA